MLLFSSCFFLSPKCSLYAAATMLENFPSHFRALLFVHTKPGAVPVGLLLRLRDTILPVSADKGDTVNKKAMALNILITRNCIAVCVCARVCHF